ncbi:MAG: glycosyltransferase family 39 protein [Candidatus Omnitrophica bacterium]|nr:glycosyltransferase family 39 protein [Candidatus Omnitrophota bacterium]MBI3021736.1 glycosyltransferase family 39 protein [Candidatus Omnitrophota bacterium]MBI3083942.1 glycosyltransferase family 39 protein [Candidatus Omnitrophota bacterium]
MRSWRGPLALGAWLSVAAVWPTVWLPIGRTKLLWPPLLIATLTVLTLIRGQRQGWRVAVGRSLWLFAVLTIAAWLPFLRGTPTGLSYPKVYQVYLLAYELGLATLIGWQAALSVSSSRHSWWTVDGWSRPLVVAPLLLVFQGLRIGHWVMPVLGLGCGAILGAWQGYRGWAIRLSPKAWRLVPVGLFVGAALLVWAAGLRIYTLTGPGQPGAQVGFPSGSDDGPAYYSLAVDFAKDPSRFFTSKMGDQVFFTGYYLLMGLWFWLVGGPHIPSWLVWQGMAGGLLAVAVYWIGRKLTGQAVFGVVAGLLVVADHVMLHLLATMNQETFFFAWVYLALLLWSLAADPNARLRVGLFAGLALGVSVIFRTTSLMLPLVWYLCMLWERPRPGAWTARRQAGLLWLGVCVPVALMVIRHRMAWGYWTLSGAHAEYKIIQWNYALQLPGAHLYDIGLVEWLRRLAAEPHLLWQHVIPSWWKQGVDLWTHRGFGQMDLVQGLNDGGPYQTALATVLSVSALVGIVAAIRRRTRLDLALLSLPLCFTSLVLIFYVLNSRYRSPFIPALYLFSCLGFSLAGPPARSPRAAGGSGDSTSQMPRNVPLQLAPSR